MNVKIDNLANHTRFIPTLAHWFHEQWGHFHPETTIEQRIARLEDRCKKTSGIPLTLIAIVDHDVIGTASLVKHDMDVHLELTPWLSSDYVIKKSRNQAIGSRLVKQIVQGAAKMDAKKLYLFTPDRQLFYTRLGWRLLYREKYRKQQVAVMEINVAA